MRSVNPYVVIGPHVQQSVVVYARDPHSALAMIPGSTAAVIVTAPPAGHIQDGDMWLVYVDAEGERHYQPWQDLQESGTLIDGETGEDMEMIGWATEPPPGWGVWDRSDQAGR